MTLRELLWACAALAWAVYTIASIAGGQPLPQVFSILAGFAASILCLDRMLG
jgi:hypothetical protein